MKAKTLLILFLLGIGFLLPKFVHGIDLPTGVHFVAAGEIDLEKILPPPPGNYSPETDAELRQIVLLQKAKTPEQVAEIRRQDPLTPAVFCGPLFLQWSTPAASRISELLALVAEDTEQIIDRSKQIWDRPRPFRLEKKIEKLTSIPPGSSYPGSNATIAYAWAALVSSQLPDQQEALYAQADAVARNRVLAGIQYPSDVAAGKLLGEAIGKKLLEKPEVQSALRAALADLKADSSTYATTP